MRLRPSSTLSRARSLLPIQRQAVGVLETAMLARSRSRRDAALDQAGGRRPGRCSRQAWQAYRDGASRSPGTSARRRRGVRWTSSPILTRAQAPRTGLVFRLDDLFDALEMSRQVAARRTCSGVGRAFGVGVDGARPVCTSSKVKAYWLSSSFRNCVRRSPLDGLQEQ